MKTQLSRIREIAFQVTNDCNLRCGFCFADSGVPKENELQVEEIQQVIDYFKGFHLESIVLTGGEPLLRLQKVKEILRYASEQGVTAGLFTNGTLISKRVAQELEECNLTWARISIDGSCSAVHDKIRGEGTFQKLIRGIGYLQDAEIEIQFRSTIFNTNYDDFPSILKLAGNLHADSIWVRPFMPVGRGISSSDKYFTTLSQREKVIRFLLKERKKLHDCPKIVFMPSCFEFLHPEYSSEDSVTLCPCGRDRIFIDCIGNIKPCGPFPIPLGSIRSDQLSRKIFYDALCNSNILQEIDSPPPNRVCSTCESWDLCKRSCYSITFAMTGSLSNVHPYCPKLLDEKARHGKGGD